MPPRFYAYFLFAKVHSMRSLAMECRLSILAVTDRRAISGKTLERSPCSRSLNHASLQLQSNVGRKCSPSGIQGVIRKERKGVISTGVCWLDANQNDVQERAFSRETGLLSALGHNARHANNCSWKSHDGRRFLVERRQKQKIGLCCKLDSHDHETMMDGDLI